MESVDLFELDLNIGIFDFLDFLRLIHKNNETASFFSTSHNFIEQNHLFCEVTKQAFCRVLWKV